MVMALVLTAALPLHASEDPGEPWDEIPILTLREAVEQGLVQAEGHGTNTYRKVRLRVQSLVDRRVVVDTAGGSLRPKPGTPRCQRLALGPPVEPESRPPPRRPGEVIVQLEPGGVDELLLGSCCLDASLPIPGRQRFVVEVEALPAVRERVMRWWVSNPETAQSAVNSAIWQSRGHVLTSAPSGKPSYPRPERGAEAWGETVYRLDAGELTALDSDGIVRILGTRMYDVLPTEQVVYATTFGDGGRFELWRLAMTGKDPWGRVGQLELTERVFDVRPAGGGNLLMVTDNGIALWQREGSKLTTLVQEKNADRASFRIGEKGRATAVTLWDHENRFAVRVSKIDTVKGVVTDTEDHWQLVDAAAGPAGVFARSHNGRLQKLLGRGFRALGPKISHKRLIAVGREVVWTVDDQNRVVVLDAGSGRVRHVTKASREQRLRLDGATDDLVWGDKDGWWVVRASDGEVVQRKPAEVPSEE